MTKDLPRITLDELMRMLADPSVPESDIARYFIEDEARSTPLNPALRPNPQYVEGAETLDGIRAAGMLSAANDYCRWRRKTAFDRRIAGNDAGPVIVAEGDSWFQYPLILNDVIDHLSGKWAINCLSSAGALLEDMVTTPEYAGPLERYGAQILLFSAGGNDLVAGGALANHLESYDRDTASQMRPEDYLRASFQQILDNAFAQYERMCRDVAGSFPAVRIISHGYDYAIPNRGRWMGVPMEKRGITDPKLQVQIAQRMVDRFNNGLRLLAQRMPNLTYVDCRGSVSNWYDELHPRNEGYASAAGRIDKAITQALAGGTRSAGTRGGRARGGDSTAEARTPQARSLHVGIDFLNTQTYAGWNGQLFGCVNDAEKMQVIATEQGYDARALHNRDATRAAVIAAVEEDAGKLAEGDHYLLTFACHGGRITDFNQDEDDGHDEALCLFDYMIADDEIFRLLSLFRPGVRVLAVIDSCNSGTVIRANPLDPFAITTGPGISRSMPTSIADLVNSVHINEYKTFARYSMIDENAVHDPMGPISASVISLSACQDTESALEINGGGRFTRALVETWANGAYRGSHRAFLDMIAARVTGYQVPQYNTYGPKDPAFEAQNPFTVTANPRGNPVIVQLECELGKCGVPQGARTPVTPEGLPEPEPVAPPPAGKPANPTGPAEQQAFLEWAAGLNLQHFTPEEFLALGGPNAPGGACAGLNTLPPPALWPNMVPTARVLDRLRGRLARPILIVAAYRSAAYRACLGDDDPEHQRFSAVDFMVQGLSPAVAAAELRQMRDLEGVFSGGIGMFDKYVHLDTNGTNTDW
ncbi:caspase family protein [Paracoccus sp. DMF-8]|uniref:caspase family protein n=1 Tax=Paracoccus sp. DMF-8 TaxID=3019445 RepID=UPI0023E7A0A6|nr:caspase family protein [Paracoccus sp. DMF-8]MDF3605373.1 caspase family protein [Paracoccus sp. DMF-8]